ncbi:MAG: signal peptidase II [Lachnospiraceae bacterium]|nr:signal peptidase II [Lachnospiraceae bacterium]
MKNRIKQYIPTLIFMIALIVLDQVTKLIARSTLADSSVAVIEGVFEFKLVYNTGVAWGMFGQSPVVITLIALIIMAVVAFVYFKIPVEKKRLRFLRILLILIFSGAAGNIIDRLCVDAVTDFLYFKLINFPVFNVADIYVTVSGILVAILLIFYYKEEDLDFLKFKRKKNNESVEQDTIDKE